MKKVVFIVLPILLLGGGFVGLAIMGVVNVPGLTPPKKAKPAPEYGEAKDKDLVAEAKTKIPNPKTPILKPKETPETDPEKGTKKLAQLWNNLPAAKLAEKEREYAETFANPYRAAARGFIDEVIQPRETRRKLIKAFAMLEHKVVARPKRKHGNVPL